MEFRKLGNSGITVSALSLGSWLTFEFIEEREALSVMARSIDGGINFLDDARYNDRTGKAPLASGYSVLFGAKTVKQIEENLGTLKVLAAVDEQKLTQLRRETP